MRLMSRTIIVIITAEMITEAKCTSNSIIVISFLINLGKQGISVTHCVTSNNLEKLGIRGILCHINVSLNSSFIAQYPLHGCCGNSQPVLTLTSDISITSALKLLLDMFGTLFGGSAVYASEPGDTLLTAVLVGF